MQEATNPAAGAAPTGPPFVCMPVPPIRSRTYDRYQSKQSIGLGITQVIIGILCMIFNSVCLGVAAQYSQYNGLGVVGHGYWCGLLFLITGIFGITAGRKKTRCQIVAFMVLCIISAVFTTALLIVGITGALTTNSGRCYYDYSRPLYGYYYDSYPRYDWICDKVPGYQVIIAMESCLAICGFIVVIVAIWGSALCCRAGVCCCSSPAMVMPTVGYVSYAGPMISFSQSQGGPYVYAPQHTFSYPQGLMPSSAYLQTGWTIPTSNVGPVLGHAPPPYATNQPQPLWMIPPATTSAGAMAKQAPYIDQIPKEIKGIDEGSCA